MQAVTLLIKDALTRHRTRAFSHINQRAFSFRVFSDNVSDNNVSEDEIRLHFRNWCKAGDRTYYGSAEITEHVFQLFKRLYLYVAKRNADPNTWNLDLYKVADSFLLESGIRGTQYGGRAISMVPDGKKKEAFADLTSCGEEKGL